MTRDPHPTASVVELSTSDCWRLLEAESLGRLALVDASGEPRIYPVNVVVRDGLLYLRSAGDAKLRFLRSRPAVAFEVDGVDGGDRWSVVVRGHAAIVETDAELRRARDGGVRSMSPTPKPYVVRIAPQRVTGRRFAERTAPGDDDLLRSRIFRPSDHDLPAAARSPHPIPGFRPRADA
jgi:nitroimidazol reductase NimA-like FMN-containing flavoprotein (pyridoxamine 5'-phosphate oxidase superfamily)